MKLIRVFVLSLMALLLPVRGAAAATMACADAAVAAVAKVAAPAHAEAPCTGEHDTHDTHDEEGAQSDTCHICASACGMVALWTSPPVPAAAPPAGPALFPGVPLPPQSFLPDGQDRPPRTR